jgi:Holliday junction resolvase-like predicted endonuclease
MAAFGEALLKQRVWYWLETELEMKVDGEVDISTGRIDLIAESTDDEIWGIEIKKQGFKEYEQANRYIESGKIDYLYIATDRIESLQKALSEDIQFNITTLSQNSSRLGVGVEQGKYSLMEVMQSVDSEFSSNVLNDPIARSCSLREYIKKKVEHGSKSKDPVSLEQGITNLTRAACPPELGVIHVPFNLTEGILRDTEKNLSPENAYQPRIVQEADQIERYGAPDFSRKEEPWVRHCIWREYGGLPEGHIPNSMDSDQPHRPIDVLSFVGSYDPTDAVENPDVNEVIGVEAKGKSSFTRKRTTNQLYDFLETSTLSRLYLAVPRSLVDKARDLLSTDSLSNVGILSVSETGEVDLVQEATRMIPKYDGYMKKYNKLKVGYGNVEIESGKEVISPFVTDEEAERLNYPDASEYAVDMLTNNSGLADDDGWIRGSVSDSLREPESEFDKGKKARGYLLEGCSADPYTQDLQKGVEADDMKPGYVRLTVTDFTVDGEDAFKFHFGRGSWEGGYIWFVGKQVDKLQNVLNSLETIVGGEVPGQGKIIDLETFPFDNANNEPHRVSGKSGEEVELKLLIYSDINDGFAARFRLGQNRKSGVDVALTEQQWLDLVATVDILRSGSYRELPGEYTSYPRIGPSGEDTWPIGTDIEKSVKPDLPSEWEEESKSFE